MKRIIFGIGFVLLVGIFVFNYNVPMTESHIVGTYINTNFSKEPCCVESPHQPDTLVLNSDGTFFSGFYGNGTYETDSGLLNTRIKWSYDYEMGKAGYSTYFSNKIYEKPKIILNFDLNHFYQKVE
ncbi:hypothetical protein ACFSRY_19100 [Pontibacter locisalis]|uniref:Uncharacterized protein n=1 Tax=Pontibacter locisalis TaxID=1719035 RepID=A0ABW5ISR0_9BACT